MNKQKLIRITTVPISLDKLLEGQMKFMNSYYDVTAISSDKNGLEKVGHKEGINTYTIEITRKITPLKDLLALIKLYVFLRKQKPKIVHTHTPKAGVIGMIAAWLANVPIRLHTVAGLPLLEINGLKRVLLNYIERLTYGCATRIYPNSYGLLKIIIENKFAKPSKLKVIGNGSSNGIDTDYFNPSLYIKEKKTQLKQKLKIKKTDFTFIFVGRIVGDKGVNELTKVFDDLSKQNKNIKLILVGTFEDELDPLQKDTKRILNNNKQIILTGYQNDVRPYLSIANVLVFPSYREGFPNVVMQAGAMEVPAIVSNINGCNEIIENNVNGRIIPVKDVKALKNEMMFFLKISENKMIEMRKLSRSKILNKYNREIVWEALLKEYQEIEQENV